MNAIYQKLIVQMRRGRVASGTYLANHLALTHSVALFDLTLVQVQVLGLDIIAVLDDDIVAVGFGVPRGDNPAITGSPYGCTTVSRIIGAAMGAHRFVDWMQAARIKVGADTAKIQWRLQESFAHAVAIRRVVMSSIVTIGIAHSAKLAPLVGELGRQNSTGANLLSVQKFLFEKKAEVVAFANIQSEIHVPAKNIGQLHNQGVVHAYRLPGDKERAVNSGFFISGLHLGFARFGLCHKHASLIANKMCAVEPIAHMGELLQLTLLIQIEHNFMAGHNAGELFALLIGRG